MQLGSAVAAQRVECHLLARLGGQVSFPEFTQYCIEERCAFGEQGINFFVCPEPFGKGCISLSNSFAETGFVTDWAGHSGSGHKLFFVAQR